MVQKQVQEDPYRVLALPHSASAAEIKRAYRDMARQYHPDRFVGKPVEQQEQASAHFARGASAYALLSDPQRKAAFDHVYKYGGFDEDQDTKNTTTSRKPTVSSRKRKTGIGYNFVDPCAFIWTRGRIESRRTTAGIEIPARMNHLGGFRFAYSSGQVVRSPSGTAQCESRTTGFAHGQRFCRTERVTIHSDGRKEVIVSEGSDVEKQQQKQQSMSSCHDNNTPWWMVAWQEVREKLTMCNSPCAASVATQ